MRLIVNGYEVSFQIDSESINLLQDTRYTSKSWKNTIEQRINIQDQRTTSLKKPWTQLETDDVSDYMKMTKYQSYLKKLAKDINYSQ